MLIGVIVLVLALALGSFVLAIEINGIKAERTDIVLQDIACKTVFVDVLINNTDSMGVGAPLGNYADKLQEDLVQLQNYAENNDSADFKEFLSSNYDVDFKVVKEAVNAWRKDNLKNLSLVQKKEIKNDYDAARATYNSCHVDSLKKYGDGRVIAFNAILDAHQEKADSLESKGADVTELNNIISDAKSQMVSPLQGVMENASGEAQIQQALRSYCLYDGCKSGINFHFEAKWELAKLDIALGRIQNSSNASAMSDKITSLSKDINDAKSALDAIGANKYTADSKKKVWDNIRSAQASVKEVIGTPGGKRGN